MGDQADTEKPHSHHAIAKDIPEDKNSKQVPKQDELRNKAAAGVCIHSSFLNSSG
jgi:hypothetical protein